MANEAECRCYRCEDRGCDQCKPKLTDTQKLKIAVEGLVDVLGRTAGDDCHNAARYALEQIAPEELDPRKWS